MINRVELLGRLALSPKLAQGENSHEPHCRLRIVTNQAVRGVKHTEYHDVLTWGRLAESCAAALTTGQVVHVQGRLHTSTREQEGEKGWRTWVIASTIHFLGDGHKGAARGAQEVAVEEAAAEIDGQAVAA